MPVIEDNYNLLLNSEAAVVTSGTATLETALFDIPSGSHLPNQQNQLCYRQ